MNYSLGTKIRTYRMQKGLTQTELSKGICTASMISQIEADRAKPSFKVLGRLADRLEVPLSYLLSELTMQMEELSKFKMARSMVAAKEYASAIPLLREMVSRNQQKVPVIVVLLLLGESYLNTNHLEEAEETFNSILQSDLLRGDVLIHVRVLENFGHIEFKRKRYQLADYHWKLAIQTLDKSNIVDPLLKARLLSQVALAYSKLGMIQDAVECFEQALPSFEGPANLQEIGKTYMHLAQSYQKLNDLERSNEYSDKAVAIYETIEDMSGKMSLLIECASVYGEIGRIDEAIRMLETSIRTFQELDKREEMAIACVQLGKVLHKRGCYAKAEEQCLIARALLPELHPYQAWVHRVLGEIARANNNIVESVNLLNRAAGCFKAVNEIGEWEETMHDLAMLHQQLHEPERALEILKEIRNGTRQVMGERGIVL